MGAVFHPRVSVLSERRAGSLPGNALAQEADGGADCLLSPSVHLPLLSLITELLRSEPGT